MIRFLYSWITINIWGYTLYCGGVLYQALKGINREYKDNESWSTGKKEALQTLIICITLLIILSCIIC